MSKKRANGEGTIRRRRNGTWECTLMYGRDPVTGKRLIKSFYSPTRYGVIEMRDKWLRESALNNLTAENYTLAELARKWFDHRRQRLKPQTAESYKYTLRHIVNGPLGHKDIGSIKPHELECWYTDLQNTYSSSTVSKIKGMIYEVFRFAEANDVISKNPARYTEKIRYGQSSSKDSYSADEVRTLMRNLPNNKIGNSIRLMIATGIRTQELLALEPKHISENGNCILIQQAVVRVKGTVMIGDCKSAESHRTVPIPPKMQKYALWLRENCTGTYIWESPKKPGQPCNPSHFRDQYRKAVENIPGMRVLSPHCCRHTFASQMQALGVSLESIRRLLGHTKLGTTQVYIHTLENTFTDAMNRFSDVFGLDDDRNDNERAA